MVAKRIAVVEFAAVVCCLSWVLYTERLDIFVLHSYSSIGLLDGDYDEVYQKKSYSMSFPRRSLKGLHAVDA